MWRKFLSANRLTTIGALLALTVLFAACRKNDKDLVNTPVAHVMAFNLAPDQDQLRFALSGNVLPGGAMSYGNYSGTYLNVFPGSRLIETFNPSSGTVIDSLQFTFQQSKYYSLFALGANGNYRNVVAVDDYDSLTASSGKSYVRYINAIPDSSASHVTIAAGGANVLDNTASFGHVSSFVGVDPGDITVSVNNESTVSANRTISLQAHKAYTVLLMGLPNQADSAKAVQIRFIENGTVTD